MSTQTAQTATLTAMPRVNLMPPEIAEAARFRQIQIAMGAAVVLSAAVVTLLYVHAKSGISSAQDAVNQANATQTGLQATVTKLSSVSDTYAGIQAKQALLDQAMGQEIRWSYILDDLSYRVPSNVWLTSISAGESTAPGSTASTPASILPGSTVDPIGAINFQGEAENRDGVAAWLDSMAKEKGFAEPTFSSISENNVGTTSLNTFNSNVLLDSNALSNRYVPKAGS